MKNLLNISIIAVFGLFLLLNSCEHKPKELIKPNSKGNDTIVINPEPVSDCDSSIAYFKNDILPILASHCTDSGCHGNIDPKEDVILTNYDKITSNFNKSDPFNSDFWRLMNTSKVSKMMPPKERLSAADRYKIWKWLNQGAKNDSCNAGCDTTRFTYKLDIKPIIDGNCIGCHKTRKTQIGTYSDLKIQVDNGNLWTDINRPKDDQKRMPPNSNLSNCDKKKIKKWIDAGAPDN